MAPNLMESAGFWLDLQQGATRLVGATKQLDGALGFFENPIVIFHGACDGDGGVG